MFWSSVETQNVDVEVNEQESYHSILTSNAMRENESGKLVVEIDEDVLADILLQNMTKREVPISKSLTSLEFLAPRKLTIYCNTIILWDVSKFVVFLISAEIIATPDICRICIQPDLIEADRCISPCHCRGTMSKVHKGCLETWLARSNTNVCEICRFTYKIVRIRKYLIMIITIVILVVLGQYARNDDDDHNTTPY